MPDPDDEASKYEIADRLLGEAGYAWYEISNFARRESGEEGRLSTQLRHASRHNLAYWRDWDWWGFGPGAHSHVGLYRWWNVKHPSAYAQRVTRGLSPAQAGEILDAQTREMERVLLAVRTSEGVEAPRWSRARYFPPSAPDFGLGRTHRGSSRRPRPRDRNPSGTPIGGLRDSLPLGILNPIAY